MSRFRLFTFLTLTSVLTASSAWAAGGAPERDAEPASQSGDQQRVQKDRLWGGKIQDTSFCSDRWAKKHKKRRSKARKRRPTRSRRWRRRPKRTRSKGPQKLPAARVRRATAGPGAEPLPQEDSRGPAWRELRKAEREAFPPNAASPSGSDQTFPPSLTLLPDPSAPVVSDSGLPPSRILMFEEEPRQPARPEFIDRLRSPDWTVRWTERVVWYLRFYKEDPRGRTIAAIWYRRSGAYEPMIQKILQGYGLPSSLMWVAVVESGLRPSIFSPAGAAGLWQMMPQTARLYGLVVDRWVDERLDPVRSTRAAAMYLQDLRRRFGSWELALAAYNMGFGGLLASVRKYNSNDYWELSRYEAAIPWETTLYVPKIMAMSVVAANPSVFGLDPDRRDPPAEFDEIDAVPGTSLQQIADAAEVDLSDIQELNPQYLVDRVPPRAPRRKAAGVWRVRVPRGRGAKVAKNLVKLRVRYPRLRSHVMRRGERLEDVARGFGVSVGWLRRVNAIRSDEVLSPGTVVLVPASRRRPIRQPKGEQPVVVVRRDLQPAPGFRRVFYRVVPGDTLAGIASALGVDPNMLRDWNGVDPSARLQRGMTLQALVPTDRDLHHMKVYESDQVRPLLVGTKEFFDYFEGKKGRVRVQVVVRPGETWRDIARRTHSSVGSLERINRRSRRSVLRPGERLWVYVSPAVAQQLKASQASLARPPAQSPSVHQPPASSPATSSAPTPTSSPESKRPPSESHSSSDQPAASATPTRSSPSGAPAASSFSPTPRPPSQTKDP